MRSNFLHGKLHYKRKIRSKFLCTLTIQNLLQTCSVRDLMLNCYTVSEFSLFSRLSEYLYQKAMLEVLTAQNNLCAKHI